MRYRIAYQSPDDIKTLNKPM